MQIQWNSVKMITIITNSWLKKQKMTDILVLINKFTITTDNGFNKKNLWSPNDDNRLFYVSESMKYYVKYQSQQIVTKTMKCK